MQKQYELMLVLKPDFDISDEKKVKDFVKKMVGAEVEIKEFTLMGKKPLAYPILKAREGIYILVQLVGDVIKTAQIEKTTKLSDVVLRYLLIRR